MSNFLKISEATSLAFHAMLFVATERDGVVPAKRIASALHVSQAHLAKVLQRLARVGLVRSTRGPKGGFQLGKPPERITLLELYEAIEGPLTAVCCLFGTPVCGRSQCIFGGILLSASSQMREYFARTTLSQLTEGGLTDHGNAKEDH